jgi:hypothetical protein
MKYRPYIKIYQPKKYQGEKNIKFQDMATMLEKKKKKMRQSEKI